KSAIEQISRFFRVQPVWTTAVGASAAVPPGIDSAPVTVSERQAVPKRVTVLPTSKNPGETRRQTIF
ncbi:MAG: hypothetical protein LKI80_01890, partial [Sporolactobacillus sp.]|nr:hypothetical protein [Sporolactobacillus sp.]